MNLKISLIFRDLLNFAKNINQSEEATFQDVTKVDNFAFIHPEFQNFLNNILASTSDKKLLAEIQELKSNYTKYFIYIRLMMTILHHLAT